MRRVIYPAHIRPNIVRAFWWAQLVDESILRAWIVSMGRRSSLERVAHLMCELYIRARNIGLAGSDRAELPLTPIVLGDALGLTPVHINRVLSRLRTDGIMELSGGVLVVADRPSSPPAPGSTTTICIVGCGKVPIR